MSADSIHPEVGLTSRRVFHQRYLSGFRSNDPFTPSISQSIRNQRMSSNAQGMDDVGPPHRPRLSRRQPQPRTHWPAPTNVPQAVQPTQSPWPQYYAPQPSQGYSAHPAVQHTSPPWNVQQPLFIPPSQVPPQIIPPGPQTRSSSSISRHTNLSPAIVEGDRHGRRSRRRRRSRARSRSHDPVISSSKEFSAHWDHSRSPRYHSTTNQGSRPHSPNRSRWSTSPSSVVLPEMEVVSFSSGDSEMPIGQGAGSSYHGPQNSAPASSGSLPVAIAPSGHYHGNSTPSPPFPPVIPPLEPPRPYPQETGPLPEQIESLSTASRMNSRPETPVSYSIPPPSISYSTEPGIQPSMSGQPWWSGYSRPLPRRDGSMIGSPVPVTYVQAQRVEDEHVEVQVYIIAFVTDTLPRQIYLHFLLRLPYLYFSRVNRIFQEADLTIEEIKEMALQATAENNKTFQYNMLNMGYFYSPETTTLSPAYQRLKNGWEHFIDNLMREWKTLNIISVLLLSAIMTMFQIQGAAEDPITRYLAFWSLICALLGLLYGCLFIIRFGTMRKAAKAAEWALEARKSQTILWNVWVMLAMPVVWLAWSILTFIGCIMSFMWRAQAKLPTDFIFSAPSPTEFAFRIFICGVLGIGVLYGALIINTFRRYGAQMDEAWKCRVQSFIDDVDPDSTQLPPPLPPPQYFPYPPQGTTQGPVVIAPSSRRSFEDDSNQSPYLAADIGTRSLGKDKEPTSAPPEDTSIVSPPMSSRPPSFSGRIYRHRHSHSRRKHPSRGRSRYISRSLSTRSHRSRSPEPYTRDIFYHPPSHVGDPSMSYNNSRPQQKEGRSKNSSRSHSRYSRSPSLDGGTTRPPPLKTPDELLHVTVITGAKDEPEKLPPDDKQASRYLPSGSGSIEPKSQVREHERSLSDDGGDLGLDGRSGLCPNAQVSQH